MLLSLPPFLYPPTLPSFPPFLPPSFSFLPLFPPSPFPYSFSPFRLGDEGAQPILKALLKNSTLTTLNLGSNDIGEPSAPALSEVRQKDACKHQITFKFIDTEM